MKKKKSMCFYLPEEEKNELVDYANVEGVSQTQIIRSAVSLYIKLKKNPNPCAACGSFKEDR